MPRLIFVNRYFFPDHSATSQLLSDLAFDLAKLGRDVHVVTGTQIYDHPKALLPAHENIHGVNVHRVPSTRFGRGALVGRAIDYSSFFRSVRCRIGQIAGRGDIIIAKTDPPLTSVVALAAAKRRGARLVNWLQDIYPETAVELGVPFMAGPLGRGLAALRNRSLRQAAATVVVGEHMGRRAAALGAAAAAIHVIPNWCDDEAIKPIPPAQNPLRRQWDLADRFVFGYSGNLGRAHEYDTVLGAAVRLRHDPRIIFLMIGGGKRFAELRDAAERCGVGHAFRFMPYQERAALAYSLGVSDIHWLSLNPRLEGLIVPSKFYGIAAAGRPILVIGDVDGELGGLVRRHGCGLAVASGDSTALADALLRLAAAPDAVAEMGARARQMLDRQFTRRQGLQRWRELLDGLLETDPDQQR